MAWCKGRRARAPPLLPSAVSQSAIFWDFDHGFSVETKVRILPMPLCWGPPGGSPRHFSKIRRRRKTHSQRPSGRILCFSGKKFGKNRHFVSGPQCRPEPGPTRSRTGVGGPNLGWVAQVRVISKEFLIFALSPEKSTVFSLEKG